MTEKKRKIAIVGTADSCKDAPFDDESWEIWTFCGAWKNIPRFDRFFEMHDAYCYSKTGTGDEKMFDFIKDAGKKAFVADTVQFPDATPFPFDRLYNKFGRYYTSTAAYVTALALLEAPTHIGLWGIHMAGDGEHAHQRACAEHYLGMIRNAGIQLFIHPDSELLRESLYPSVDLWKVRQKIEAMKERAREAECKSHYEAGKRDMLLLLEREMR